MIGLHSNPELTKILKCGVSVLAISAFMSGTSGYAGEGEAEAKAKGKAKSSVVKEIVVAQEAAPAAQEADDDDDEDDLEEETDEIFVTGSRLSRSEFTSASPIQIIDGEISRELGLFNTAEVLQQSVQTAGQQVDNSFTGFVLAGGAGSAQIGFRGLGAGRTLVLMNGRRMAPAGVGGAPVAADLSLIPSVMIQRIENLFDGASTIYGSDAIAGVSNVIMKKNVEGFELQGNYKMPRRGGQELVLSGMWGKTFDKGFITIGAEYYDRKVQTYGQSAFTDGCDLVAYEDESGNRLPHFNNNGGTGNAEVNTGCHYSRLVGRMIIPGLGSVYSTPGSTNVGIPGWSDTTLSSGWVGFPGAVQYDSNSDGIIGGSDAVFLDGDGDGFIDVNLQDPQYNFSNSERGNMRDWVSPQERFTINMNGEYLVHDDSNTTFFFDGYYSKRKNEIYSPSAQMFPFVAPTNPYNPCNQSAGGVNCLAPYDLDWGDVEARTVVRIDGDRDNTKVDIYQYRIMGGLRGDLPFAESWGYEVFGSYSQSEGTDLRRGMHEDRLAQSLDASFDGDGNVVCNDPSNGCVAVDLFSDQMMGLNGGTLTAAEDAFLFADRIIETKVRQAVAGAWVDGKLFTLPWNDEEMPLGVGYEFRRDNITSNPNDVSADGLLWGFFNDEGADGTRDLHEFFAETEIPLLRGQPMAEELTVIASGRWTKESFYDAASTYSIKVVYKPFEWLTGRLTHGSSYRAPNLRERFLNGTSGFSTIADPCFVPQSARIGNPDPTVPDVYVANLDTRLQHVLDSCAANGVDPTSWGLLNKTGTGAFSTEVKSGGAEDLFAETSKSTTFGFVIEQPWTDNFDLKLSATWFNITLTDSIENPGNATIVQQCYNNVEQPDGSSFFCNRIERDGSGRISLVRRSPINVGLQTSKGIDFNALFTTSTVVGDKDLGITVDLRATHMKEQFEAIIPGIDFDENAGETDIPKWRGEGRLSLDYDDFRFNWQIRFIGKGEENETTFRANGAACTHLPGVSCRPIYYTEDYWVHNTSIAWGNGSINATVGVRNVFNTAPPIVDGGGVFSVRNVPLGVGYDLYGRQFYFNMGYKF